ncbi:hypothetical protein DESC_700035 [Desulfosarcina cetonica]|nr:hypothetical protein DESC_700035 [Desulfosarcina cetonica]
MKEKTDADPNQIGGPGKFHDGKSHGGRGQDHRQAQGGQQGMHPNTGHDAEHRDNAGPSPLGQAAADNVHGILPGGEVEQDAGEDVQREIMDSKHECVLYRPWD